MIAVAPRQFIVPQGTSTALSLSGVVPRLSAWRLVRRTSAAHNFLLPRDGAPLIRFIVTYVRRILMLKLTHFYKRLDLSEIGVSCSE